MTFCLCELLQGHRKQLAAPRVAVEGVLSLQGLTVSMDMAFWFNVDLKCCLGCGTAEGFAR